MMWISVTKYSLAFRKQSSSLIRRNSNLSLLEYVPGCPPADPNEVERLQDFVLCSQRLFVMTGAGISTESGIPDYRSEGVGLYARTERRPIQHAEFVRNQAARRRYWARNFVGWPQFSSHKPNVAHLALYDYEKAGKLHWLVTQNVDALHSKAGNHRLTELHGCTHRPLMRPELDICPIPLMSLPLIVDVKEPLLRLAMIIDPKPWRRQQNDFSSLNEEDGQGKKTGKKLPTVLSSLETMDQAPSTSAAFQAGPTP